MRNSVVFSLAFIIILVAVVHAKNHHKLQEKIKSPKVHKAGETIASATLFEVSYPTLSSVTSGLTPAVLHSSINCNQASTAIARSISYTATAGDRRCWTAAPPFTATNYGVSAGAPAVSNGRWIAGPTAKYPRCQSSARTITTTYSFTTLPRSKCTLTISQYSSVLNNLPFRGKLRLTYSTGRTSVASTSGAYTGAYITTPRTSISCTALGSGTCASPLGESFTVEEDIVGEQLQAEEGLFQHVVEDDDDDDDDDNSTNLNDDDDDDDDNEVANASVRDDDDDDDDDDEVANANLRDDDDDDDDDN